MDFGALAASGLKFGTDLIVANEQQHRAADVASAANAFTAQQRATQYQTAVADMKAAGLNPMLAYSQGGAGFSPAAVAAIPQQATLDYGPSSAYAVKEAVARTGQQESSSRRNDAETRVAEKNAGLLEANRQLVLSKLGQMPLIGDKLRAEIANTDWHAALARVQTKLEQFNLTDMKPLERYKLSVQGTLLGLELPKALNEANAQDSWWKKNVSPYLGDIVKAVGISAGAVTLAR